MHPSDASAPVDDVAKVERGALFLLRVEALALLLLFVSKVVGEAMAVLCGGEPFLERMAIAGLQSNLVLLDVFEKLKLSWRQPSRAFYGEAGKETLVVRVLGEA